MVKTVQFHIKDYIKKLDSIQLSDPNNTHPKVLKELTKAIPEPLNIIYEFLEDTVPLIAITHHLPFRKGKDISKSNKPNHLA